MKEEIQKLTESYSDRLVTMKENQAVEWDNMSWDEQQGTNAQITLVAGFIQDLKNINPS